MSKDLLRNEFNKVKPKIHTRMTNYLGDSSFTSSTDYRTQGNNGSQNTTKI